MVGKIINYLLDCIYPKRCIFCEEVLPIKCKEFLCEHCLMDITFIYDDKEPNIAVFEYDEVTRYSILRLKYYDKKQYAKYFAKMMYDKLKTIDFSKYDIIINVPMYIKKKKKRGYDQAELLAIEISKLCGINIEKGNLIRHKNTLAQSKVSYEERASNVAGIFSLLYPENIKNKNILLVDDIYTSGNTIMQCEKVLKKALANKVCFFTLAKVNLKK